LNSRLQGHPSVSRGIEGVRVASGSLGQGLSVAIGAAIAKKLNNDKSLVYCLMGDGELQEGQVWEAAMFAPVKKIDNIIVTIDYNHKQIDGDTDDVLSLGVLKDKWLAFGWNVFEMNGNHMQDVVDTLKKAKKMAFKNIPTIIIMHTKMGFGVDFMENDHHWHGIAPNDEQLSKALAQLKETLGDY
jgi:transketolase